MPRLFPLRRSCPRENELYELTATPQNQLRMDPANTDRRTGVVLLADNSGSTGLNGVIHQVNDGLTLLREELLKDSIAARRIQLAGFSFGGTLRAFTDGFVSLDEFAPPTLTPGGLTPMAKSLRTVCDHVTDFKRLCHDAAVECGPIEVLVLTDGQPTDRKKILAAARRRMLELEEDGWAKFHVFAVDGCDRSVVDDLFPRPSTLMGPHSQVVGKTRSGKSVTMTLWLQSVMPWLFPGSNTRAVVFDPKAELLPIILGMEPPCPVISLCPLHQCGYAWDFAADVRTPSEARTFAAMLIPDEGETQKYFPRTAQRILEGVVRILIARSPGRWDLQDILTIFRDTELLRKMLESDASTRHLVDKYFEPETTWKNTLSTLDVHISRFETVAACWRHAANEGRTITLSDFLSTSSVLVISRMQDLRDALDPINRLIFQRLFELLLAGPEANLLPEDRRPRTYILLDEVAKGGKIELLDDIMLQGAGKGVRVFLAYQSISSMRAEYGDKEADALVGQCSNTGIYQVDPETAEWAARWFGEHEVLEDLQASSGNLLPNNHKSHLQRSKLQTLLPSQFMTLPFPQETRRISGYYLTDGIGAYEVRFPFLDLLPQPANMPIIPRRPASQQRLPDIFPPEDIQRLRLGELLARETPTDTQAPQPTHSRKAAQDSVRYLRDFRRPSHR